MCTPVIRIQADKHQYMFARGTAESAWRKGDIPPWPAGTTSVSGSVKFDRKEEGWLSVGYRSVPGESDPNRLSLSKRVGRRDGWQTIAYDCRGVMVQGRYKTFLATSHIVGGQVRVVLLEHASGNWAAYISTDASMSVEAILQIVSDRWAIEEHFHDLKETWVCQS